MFKLLPSWVERGGFSFLNIILVFLVCFFLCLTHLCSKIVLFSLLYRYSRQQPLHCGVLTDWKWSSVPSLRNSMQWIHPHETLQVSAWCVHTRVCGSVFFWFGRSVVDALSLLLVMVFIAIGYRLHTALAPSDGLQMELTHCRGLGFLPPTLSPSSANHLILVTHIVFISSSKYLDFSLFISFTHYRCWSSNLHSQRWGGERLSWNNLPFFSSFSGFS